MIAPWSTETSSQIARHDATGKSRVQTSSYGKGLKWTAGRCLRLLRPLSSKISLLSKERENVENGPSIPGVGIRGISHEEREASTTFSCPLGSKESQESQQDQEDWEPNPRPKKRIRCRYGRMRIQNPSFLSIPVETSKVETVDFSQAAGSGERKTKESMHTHPGRDGVTESLKPKCSAKPRQAVARHELPAEFTKGESSERWKLCKGIADSLSSLLKATDQGEAIETGSASLYSTCLRQVPRMMLERERQLRDEDPDDDNDLISDFYAELEERAVSDNWKPLGQIARAHGVQLIKRAIEHNYLSPSMASALVKLAWRLGALPEAFSIMESVVESLIKSRKVDNGDVDVQNAKHLLEMLQASVKATDRHAVPFRLLSRVLKHCSVASFQLYCSSDFMASALRTLTNEELDHNALSVIDAVTGASYCDCSSGWAIVLEAHRRVSASKRRRHMLRRWRSRNAEPDMSVPLKTRISTTDFSTRTAEVGTSMMPTASVCSFMSALMVVRLMQASREASHGPTMAAVSLDSFFRSLEIRGLAMIELQALESDASPTLTRELNLAVIFLTLSIARVLSRTATDDHGGKGDPLFDVLTALDLSDDDLLQLGELLVHVSKLSEQYQRHEAFKLTETVVTAICESTKLPTFDDQRRKLLERLAVACAFTFAADSNQPSHMEWALSVEGQLFGKNVESAAKLSFQTPIRATNRKQVGYRWEEGISEWTGKTPGSLQCQLNDATSRCDELDELTVAGLSPSRTRKVDEVQKRKQASRARQQEGRHSTTKLSDRPQTARSEAVGLPRKGAAQNRPKQLDITPNPFNARLRHGGLRELGPVSSSIDQDELGAAWHIQSPTRVALTSTKMVQGRRLVRERQASILRASHMAARNTGRRDQKLSSLIDGFTSDSDFEDELSF